MLTERGPPPPPPLPRVPNDDASLMRSVVDVLTSPPSSLVPGARNKHRGPRNGGITKDAKKKKKGHAKQSTLRCE